jgi:hypothetical protein
MTSVAPILTFAEPFAYHEVHQVCKLELFRARKNSLAGVKIQIIGTPLQVPRYESTNT